MYGTAVMPTIPRALEEAAAKLCPAVEVRLLNGDDLNLGAVARAASDTFLSLVDCLQETFGLTPIEAMASRLPVVASDWNGYRDTVVEGRTGFRIPTQSFEPGWNDLQLQQLAYQDPALDPVSARISSQIGVDVAATGDALARLAKSPEMAVAMGCLGEQPRSTTTGKWCSSNTASCWMNFKTPEAGRFLTRILSKPSSNSFTFSDLCGLAAEQSTPSLSHAVMQMISITIFN